MIRSGRFHHGDEWLAASLGTDYPDAVVQACQILDNFRTGDVFVSLAPGWKAKSSRYRATHGSLFVTDMHVPMIISGPDIRSGEIPSARLVDIYPTALRLLGLDVPFGTIDGRPLDELLPESLTHQTDSRKAEIEALAPAMCRLWELETDAGDGSPLRAEQARRELLRSIANQWDLLGQVLEHAHRRASHYLEGHEFHGLEGRLSRSLVRDREKDIARILSLLEQLEVSAASCCPSDHASIR
jgi:hypothetical protein